MYVLPVIHQVGAASTGRILGREQDGVPLPSGLVAEMYQAENLAGCHDEIPALVIPDVLRNLRRDQFEGSEPMDAAEHPAVVHGGVPFVHLEYVAPGPWAEVQSRRAAVRLPMTGRFLITAKSNVWDVRGRKAERVGVPLATYDLQTLVGMGEVVEIPAMEVKRDDKLRVLIDLRGAGGPENVANDMPVPNLPLVGLPNPVLHLGLIEGK